jgi:hypothetical protein
MPKSLNRVGTIIKKKIMKKIVLLILCAAFAMIMQAQVVKTINITAGTLSTALTTTEKNTITNLTLTGNIDATDFVTMRENMPKLSVIDLSGVNIVAYSGNFGPLGTIGSNAAQYNANAIPSCAFDNPNTWNGKPSLTSILLPVTDTSIGDRAFEDCSALTSVTIPTSVTIIGSYSFSSCSALSSIVIPSSVTYIGNGVFINTILTSVSIPSSVTKLGKNAFQYCEKLTSVTFENPCSITYIEPYTFSRCISLKNFTVPSSVQRIGGYAFETNSALGSFSLPSSVTSMGLSVFFNCGSLVAFYAYPQTPIDIMNKAVFEGVNQSTCTLYVPVGTADDYKWADTWRSFNISATLTSTVSKYLNENTTILYPNPANSSFSINIDEEAQVEIYSSMGSVIQKVKVSGKENIPLSVPSGLYVVKITTAKGVVTKSLVVEK